MTAVRPRPRETLAPRVAASAPTPTPAAIHCAGVVKSYLAGSVRVPALRGVDLAVTAGDHVAIVGPSGSGKSTLLTLLAALDTPDEGRLTVAGTALDALDEQAAARFRRDRVGIVFQAFHLIAELSVVDNVALPALLARRSGAAARGEAERLLGRAGLEGTGDRFPHELSGGERQRVAVARALINDPPVLLADEPTGNLDQRSAARVLALLDDVASDGRTLLVVTHDEQVAAHAARRVELVDGLVVSDTRHPAGA